MTELSSEYSWLNWAVFIVASLILIGIGYLVQVRLRKAKAGESGFLLGGREMGAFVAAGTLMATGYSGWGFIGSPGTAYAYGTIEVLGNFFFAPAITFGSLFFANFMRRHGEKYGALTVPEYLGNTHRGPEGLRRVVHFVAALATFIFLSVYIIGQIRAVGLVASSWLGISIEVSAILFMIVVMIFTMQGGLLAVAITDTLMCCGMVLGSIILYWYIVKDISLTELLQKVGEMKPSHINPETSTPYGEYKYSVFLVFVYASLFTTVLPYMSVRFLAFKKDLKISLAALYMAPMGFFMSLIPIVGLYVYYKNPGLENPDMAMPYFLANYVPPILGGMMSLFIMFAMLSTISSVLQVLASSLSHDMFVSLANKESRYADTLNRGAVVVTGVMGIVLTFFAPQTMLNHIAYIGTGGLISMLVGPTIMRTIVDANLTTCFLSMLTGFFANVYLVIYGGMGWVESPIVAGIAGSIVYLVVGYVTNGMKRIPEGREVATD